MLHEHHSSRSRAHFRDMRSRRRLVYGTTIDLSNDDAEDIDEDTTNQSMKQNTRTKDASVVDPKPTTPCKGMRLVPISQFLPNNEQDSSAKGRTTRQETRVKKKTETHSKERKNQPVLLTLDDENEAETATKKTEATKAEAENTEHEGNTMQTVPIGRFEPGGALRAGELKSSAEKTEAMKAEVENTEREGNTMQTVPIGYFQPGGALRAGELNSSARDRVVRRQTRVQNDRKEHTHANLMDGDTTVRLEDKQLSKVDVSDLNPSPVVIARNKEHDEIEEVDTAFAKLILKDLGRNKQEEYQDERFKKLTREESEWFDVHATRRNRRAKPVRVRAAGITLQYEDLSTLRGQRWLNDEIINSFAALLNCRNRDYFHHHRSFSSESEINCERVTHSGMQNDGLFGQPRPRTHMFSSFFFTRLTSSEDNYDYSGVRRWPKRAGIDIKSLDLVLFPINLHNSHWVLVVVDIRAREFVYIDSMGGSDRLGVLDTFQRWLFDEIETKHGRQVAMDMKIDSWSKVVNPWYTPQQKDGASCGVFLLYNADYLELGRQPNFRQKHMTVLRKRTALFLYRNRLADHPAFNVQ